MLTSKINTQKEIPESVDKKFSFNKKWTQFVTTQIVSRIFNMGNTSFFNMFSENVVSVFSICCFSFDCAFYLPTASLFHFPFMLCFSGSTDMRWGDLLVPWSLLRWLFNLDGLFLFSSYLQHLFPVCNSAFAQAWKYQRQYRDNLIAAQHIFWLKLNIHSYACTNV